MILKGRCDRCQREQDIESGIMFKTCWAPGCGGVVCADKPVSGGREYKGYPQVRIPPVALEILLHSYYSPQPSPYIGTAVFAEWTRWFLANDLIKQSDDIGVYSTTERGEAMVNMLCNSPLPKKQTIWVDPRTGEEIKHE